MASLVKSLYMPLFWLGVILFISFYPMLISIYVFLPLFIGAMIYVFIRGIDKNNPYFMIVSLIYLLNLEMNLSLPLFLTVIAGLLFYVFIYPYLTHFRKCMICTPVLSVIFLNLIYLGCLFSYDFIFQTQSIVLDIILVYSLIVDILIVVML